MEVFKREFLIFLDHLHFLTYIKRQKLIELYNSYSNDLIADFLINDKQNYDKNMLSLFSEFLKNCKEEICLIISESDYEKIVKNCTKEYIDKILTDLIKSNITALSIFDENYPNKLKSCDNPPLMLYCKGNLQLLNKLSIAIVGTRKPTDYGKIVTQDFSKKLSQDFVIISGLASGVDSIAHMSALEQNANTIAVIAGGFDHVYPAENYHLFNKIVENNLAVTECPPSMQPLGYMFPMRNRIIAGLSDAVLITEAGLKSGTMHTKNYAIEYGKPLFAIPGKITSKESEGCNEIIRTIPSSIVTCADDIYNSLNISTKKYSKNMGIQLDFDELNIIDYIKSDKKSYQEILDFIKLAPQKLNAVLMTMQIKGAIQRLPNNYYIACIGE